MSYKTGNKGLIFDIVPAKFDGDFLVDESQKENKLDIESHDIEETHQLPLLKTKKTTDIVSFDSVQESSTAEDELLANSGGDFSDVKKFSLDTTGKPTGAIHRDVITRELETELASNKLSIHDLDKYGGVSHLKKGGYIAYLAEAKPANTSSRTVDLPPRMLNRRSIEFERSVNVQNFSDDLNYDSGSSYPSNIAQYTSVVEPVENRVDADDKIERFLNRQAVPLETQKVQEITYSEKSSKKGNSAIGRWGASFIMFIVVFLMVVWIGARQGLFIKKNIIQNGQNALHNFEDAKVSLEAFKFNQAAASFALAYSDLEKASYNFGAIGAQLSRLISRVPVLNSAYSANAVIEVGLAISKSGEYLSKAMNSISEIDFARYIDVNDNSGSKQSLGVVIKDFGEILSYARENIARSESLLKDIDPSTLDLDKRVLIEKLQAKVPLLSDYINKAVDLADFAYGLVGDKGERTYMLIFQNNTELRATGGFIGSYALLTFKNGNLVKIFVDDIYNPDGQLKQKIIPPKPMQHITPTAGTRDANWFPDFPKSASRIIDYYKKSVGVDVDGVISITPDVFTDILKIVGHIDMPAYQRTITADNFIAQVQDEIEYGDNRHQPKTILKDLQPVLFSKLKSLPKEKYGEIVLGLIRRVEDKHILAYFEDPKLQSFVLEHKIAGEIRKVSEGDDYISVILTNVKGSKSDAVTSTNYSLDVFSKNNIHELQITRKHNGGDHDLGFYNRQNPAYTRVYLPKNSKFISIEGNDTPAYRPLLKYDSTFVPDRDISSIEASMTHPSPEVDIWHENDKMVVGFWTIVNPKSSKSIKLTYSVDMPKIKIGDSGSNYKMLWQKQSGMKNSAIDFKYHLDSGDSFVSADKDVRVSDGVVVFSAPQNQDHELEIKLK